VNGPKKATKMVTAVVARDGKLIKVYAQPDAWVGSIDIAIAKARTAAFLAPVGTPAHSGHLIPTGAKTMQSVQIGRPQLEHVTAVSLRGWR